MMCLGLKPGAAVLYVQTNPLSYGGIPYTFAFTFCKTKLGFYISAFLSAAEGGIT